MVALGILFGFQKAVRATPFASALKRNVTTISFILNEDADSVKVVFNSGTITNDLGAMVKGSHSIAHNGATNYQVVVSKTTPLGWTQISLDSNVNVQFYGGRGVAVNNYPSNNALFGRTYVANGNAGTTSVTGSRPTTDGIYVLNSDLSDSLGQGNNGRLAGITFDATSFAGLDSPWRVEVGPDNYLYICDFSTNTGTLYRTDANVTTNVMVLHGQGWQQPTSDPTVHNEITAIVPRGSLDTGNLVLYGIDARMGSAQNATVRWNVGAGPLPFTTAPTILTPGRLSVGHLVGDLDIAPDGKFFVSFNRSAGTDTDSIRVYDTDGSTVLWGSLVNGTSPDQLLKTRGIKISPDGKTVAAIRDDNTTMLISLTNGIPSLGNVYILNTFPTTPTVGREVAWDAAGNLYALSSGREALRVFSKGGASIATTSDDGTGTNGTFTISTPGSDPGILTQPQNVTVNAGVSATFTTTAAGTAPFSYQWRFGASQTNISGATASSYTRSNAQTNTAGNYSVVITNSSGSVTSAIAVLTVNSTAPIITVQPVGLTQAAGTNPKFTVTTTGSDTRSYQWRFNGTNISAATATSYTRSNAQTNDSGPYLVVVTNIFGAVTSSAANLTITNSAPVFGTQPKTQSVFAGSNVTFTVTTSQGSDPRFYQWRREGVPIDSATNTSYIITDAQQADAGNYSVSVSNFLGSITSADATLTVIDTLPIFGLQPKTQTNGAGSNIVFTITSLGTDPRTYQWQYNSVDIPGATTNSLALNNLQISDAGNYSLTISNSLGLAASTNAALTVTNRAPIITTNPVAVVTSVGGSASFSVAANGQAPLNYQWYADSTPVSGGTSATLNLANVQVSNAGFYSAVVGSGAGTYYATSQVAQLAVTIASTAGAGTGLRGDYYSNQFQTFTNAPNLTRIDTNVDFNFGSGSPDPAISADKFTARWTGQVQPLYSQPYIFYTKSDDGSRLWVNGQLVVNRWVNQAVTETASAAYSLVANQKYDVVMEYYDNTSFAEAHLLWSSPSQAKQAIQMTQLYPASTNVPVTPALTLSMASPSLVFDWQGSFVLQTSLKVDGPYTNLSPLTISPYTNQLTELERYFRLKAN